MHTSTDGGFFHELATLIISAFLAWIVLQPNGEQLSAAYNTVIGVLREDLDGHLTPLRAADGYQQACWLQTIAHLHGFAEMSDVFCLIAHRFARVLPTCDEQSL